MHPFPHRYRVESTVEPSGVVFLTSGDLPPLPTTTPPEFDGPDGSWSPETLLVAAVVDCYALTFRGIARVARLPWTALTVNCVGTLERPEGRTRFTGFDLDVRVTLPPEASEEQARRVAARAEETCLITNSLTGATRLQIAIDRTEDVTVAPV